MLSRLTFLKKPAPVASVEVHTVYVEGREMNLTVRRDRRARRLTLKIEPGGKGLKLTVPHGVGKAEIRHFMDRHHGWLVTRLSKFPHHAKLAEGRSIPLRGVSHRIVRTGKLRDATRALTIEGEPVILVGGAEEHLARRLRDFLKTEARRDLEILAQRHAALIGMKIKAITFKDTKSRWGSCSHDGKLSFSWRIVMAPPGVIEYLSAHEVSHLKEMNHSSRFWAICKELCPETEYSRAWLKRNGAMLHIHEF